MNIGGVGWTGWVAFYLSHHFKNLQPQTSLFFVHYALARILQRDKWWSTETVSVQYSPAQKYCVKRAFSFLIGQQTDLLNFLQAFYTGETLLAHWSGAESSLGGDMAYKENNTLLACCTVSKQHMQKCEMEGCAFVQTKMSTTIETKKRPDKSYFE